MGSFGAAGAGVGAGLAVAAPGVLLTGLARDPGLGPVGGLLVL